MQDILASSPIMSTIATRHQAASTPINTDDNKYTNKHLKQENCASAFYDNQIDSNVAVTAATGTNEPLENENHNNAVATAMAFHYRNNFSVNNLANLSTESQQQQSQQNLGAWCYPLENNYGYNRSNFKSFHQSYQPFTDVNYPYNNVYPQQTSAEMAAYNQLPTILQSPLNTYNEVSSSNNLSPIDSKKAEHKAIPAYASSSSSPTLIKHELTNAYPSYNQLSSSQISSSSFNTSHSSTKSVSPKANEFLNPHYQQSFASGQLQTKPSHQSNSSGSSLSSPHSIGTSIANLSSSSGAFSNANQIVVNTVSSASSSSVSSSSSSSLPANSTESFDWMKPVKTQPNGNLKLLLLLLSIITQ